MFIIDGVVACLIQMFIFENADKLATHQFEITGSTYAPDGKV